VIARVRFTDLRSATRSVTLDAPISATFILAEIAEELVTKLLAEHPRGEDNFAAGDLCVTA
jgi:DNA polymerase IV